MLVPEVESWLQDHPYRAQQTTYLHIENQATGKNRSCNVKDFVHELPVNLWNVEHLAELENF